MYCTNCGKEIKDGANFCTECGAAVNQQFVQMDASADLTTNNLNSPSRKLKILLIIVLTLIAVIGIIAAITLVPQCTNQPNQPPTSEPSEPSGESKNPVNTKDPAISTDTNYCAYFLAESGVAHSIENKKIEQWNFENGKFTITNPSSNETKELRYGVAARGDQAIRDYVNSGKYSEDKWNDAFDTNNDYERDIRGTSNWVELVIYTSDSSQTVLGTIFVADAGKNAEATKNFTSDAQAKFIPSSSFAGTKYSKNSEQACRLNKTGANNAQ